MKLRFAARLVASTLAGVLAAMGAWSADACTSLKFQAEDGTQIYARTMEWGASDLKSEMVLVPRATSFSSALRGGKTGMAWKNQYGFVGINAAGLPYATDGMNEAGLTVGALFFPGFAGYQEPSADTQAQTVSNVDLVNYLLSNFKTVAEVREAMPKIRVARNADIEKEFGTPLPLHHIVNDATGDSLVIEYTGGELKMFDNKVGAMTNSPNYDWHLLNLRNYAKSEAARGAGARYRRRLAGPVRGGKRHARIAWRLHPAVPLHPGGRLRQHHDAGQERGGSRQRCLGDAQQLRYPEGARARRRRPGGLSPRLYAMVRHRRHDQQGLLLLDHVRPQNAQRRSLQTRFQWRESVLFPAQFRPDRGCARSLRRFLALIRRATTEG